MVKKAGESSTASKVIQYRYDKSGNLSQVVKRSSNPPKAESARASSSRDIRAPSMSQRMQTIESMREQAQRQHSDYNSITNQLDGVHIGSQPKSAYTRSFDLDQINWADSRSTANATMSYEQQQMERPIQQPSTQLDGPVFEATEETDDEAQPPSLHVRQELARGFILSAIEKSADEQPEDLWNALKHLTKLEVSKQPLSSFKNSQTKCARDSFKCPEATVVRYSIDNESSKYHANYIKIKSMPEAKLIASQHPPTSANGQINFMKMLFCVADAVFDIRSEVDMTKADAVSYLPRSQDKKVVGPIEVVKNSYRDYSNILKERNVTLKFNSRLQKNLKVFQYRRWPDASITTPNALRHLADVLGAQLALGRRVLIHCRMGVGRTGTLITYFDARKQLLDAAKEVTLEDIHSLVFKNLLNYRKERGEVFIQKLTQFNLVLDTLKVDMQRAGLLVDESDDSLGILDLVSISG